MPERPVLECRETGLREGAELEETRAAFAAAEPCPLGQAWLQAPESRLQSGAVRVARRERTLLVLAELDDADIHTSATRPNQRFWELGDTFEMFLEPEGATRYLELHVAPNGLTLQLRIPIPRPAVEPETLMVEGPLFERRVWVEAGRWTVLASVPFASIGGPPARFSFCRYDYTRERSAPVLSSTSPYSRLDFHRRHEWGILRQP